MSKNLHSNLTSSRRHQRPGTEKNIVIIVALTALIFVAASAVMSQWSIREMSKIVRGQFNEEQMVIVHNVKKFIEREFSIIKKEMRLLSLELEKNQNPDKAIRSILARVIECGVSKIEFRDVDTGIVYSGYPDVKCYDYSWLEWSMKDHLPKFIPKI